MTKLREPSSVVEMAEMCRDANQRIVNTKVIDEEIRTRAKDVLIYLSSADFYELDEGVSKATDMVFETQFHGKTSDTLVLDEDFRLPSKVCMFWSRGTNIRFPHHEEDGGFPFAYLAVEDDFHGRRGTIVYMVSPYFAPIDQGAYLLGVEAGLYSTREGSEEDEHRRIMHVLTVASMCSLLNQPGVTKKEPAGSRQERRAAQRSGGYAADAWHKVTWNIGEEVKAKLTRDEPVRCMPLHYTRGHWRRAEEGWKNTTLRKDGLWYQWIEGFWSGHPAFGVKKAYHAPKMGKSTF